MNTNFTKFPEIIRKTITKRRLIWILFTIILVVGIGFRVANFPSVPDGLHQDEIAAGYESYSLLTNHTDRWGYHLPVYFPAWGSGQNVLESYLMLPSIKLFGLNTFSVRLVPLLLGILSIPLIFFATRKWYGAKTALIAMGLLAICPWHIVLSRWGLESNLLPFFLLLGVTCLTYALSRPSNRIITVLSLLPFALALYAYGVSFIVISGFFVLILAFYWKRIWELRRYFIPAGILFGLVAAPFLLFMLKNYVTKTNYSFESHLPFSVPLLPVTRLSQVGDNILQNNTQFILSGFNDHSTWNLVPNYLPLAPVVLGLALLACGIRIYRLIKSKKERAIVSPFLLWLVACFPIFFIVSVNVNQSNAIYIPIVVLAADGLVLLLQKIKGLRYKIATLSVVAVLVVGYTAGMYSAYMSQSYARASAATFYTGFEDALIAADKLAGLDPLYVTNSIQLNYVQVLFYLKIHPKDFQAASPSYGSPNFGKYYFSEDSTSNLDRYTFIVQKNDKLKCSKVENLQTMGQWKLGVCVNKNS